MNAPGGPLSRFTGAQSRRAVPRLAGLADRKSALRKAGKDYLKYDRTVLQKERKRLSSRFKKLARKARR